MSQAINGYQMLPGQKQTQFSDKLSIKVLDSLRSLNRSLNAMDNDMVVADHNLRSDEDFLQQVAGARRGGAGEGGASGTAAEAAGAGGADSGGGSSTTGGFVPAWQLRRELVLEGLESSDEETTEDELSPLPPNPKSKPQFQLNGKRRGPTRSANTEELDPAAQEVVLQLLKQSAAAGLDPVGGLAAAGVADPRGALRRLLGPAAAAALRDLEAAAAAAAAAGPAPAAAPRALPARGPPPPAKGAPGPGGGSGGPPSPEMLRLPQPAPRGKAVPPAKSATQKSGAHAPAAAAGGGGGGGALLVTPIAVAAAGAAGGRPSQWAGASPAADRPAPPPPPQGLLPQSPTSPTSPERPPVPPILPSQPAPPVSHSPSSSAAGAGVGLAAPAPHHDRGRSQGQAPTGGAGGRPRAGEPEIEVPLGVEFGYTELPPLPLLPPRSPAAPAPAAAGEGGEGEEEEVDEWRDDYDPGYVLVQISEEEFLALEEEAAEAAQRAALAKQLRGQLAAWQEEGQGGDPHKRKDKGLSEDLAAAEAALAPGGGGGGVGGVGGGGAPLGSPTSTDRARGGSEAGYTVSTAPGEGEGDSTADDPAAEDGGDPAAAAAAAAARAAAAGGAGARAQGGAPRPPFDPAAALWPKQPEDYAFSQADDDSPSKADVDPAAAEAPEEYATPEQAPKKGRGAGGSGGGGGPKGTGAAAAAAAAGAGAGAPARRRKGELAALNLRIVHVTGRTGFEESKHYNPPLNEVIAGRYQVREFLGQAAFSTALQCVDLEVGRARERGKRREEEEEGGGGEGEGGGGRSPGAAAAAAAAAAAMVAEGEAPGAKDRPKHVCLKVIKNNKDFFDQSLDEIKLLKYINSAGKPDRYHVLQMFDYFYYKEHLIIVSELLRENLYEFGKYIRDNNEEPYFTIPRLQKIMRQCLEALVFINRLDLIHCDIKPENIVIKSYSRVEVKLIDFGSSCYTTDHLTSYIQSRSYRAPEVVLGLPYGQKIDVWSLGCVLAEMLTGYVLFQNDSVQTMLARIQGVLEPFPEKMLEHGRDVPKYFTSNNLLYERADGGGAGAGAVAAAAAAAAAGGAGGGSGGGGGAAGGDFLLIYPKKTTLRRRLRRSDPVFLDFARRMLAVDPDERPTAEEALRHPWILEGLKLKPEDIAYCPS